MLWIEKSCCVIFNTNYNGCVCKLLIILLFCSNLFANSESYNFFNSYWKISKNAFKALENEFVLVESTVKSSKKQQSFKMRGMAYHPKACTKVIKKLSYFENYPNMIDFIKSVKYQEKHSFLTVKADHTLLPYPMIIHVIMKRPTKEGVYPFKFATGMFSGLKGSFTIKEVDNRCSVFVQSNWKGPDTKIPDLAIELFSETLTKIAVRTLIRKTSL